MCEKKVAAFTPVITVISHLSCSPSARFPPSHWFSSREALNTGAVWSRGSQTSFLTGKWEWLSDAPSLHPPCSDAVSYYAQFGRTPGFTSVAGRRFKGVLEEHLELLRWPEGTKASDQWNLQRALRETRLSCDPLCCFLLSDSALSCFLTEPVILFSHLVWALKNRLCKLLVTVRVLLLLHVTLEISWKTCFLLPASLCL